MSIDERSRHELYVGLEAVLGRERADTMMALLPPVGWAEVATKHDIANLGTELRSEMSALRAEIRAETQEMRAEMSDEFGKVRAEMADRQRQLVLALVPIIVAINGVAVALVALLS